MQNTVLDEAPDLPLNPNAWLQLKEAFSLSKYPSGPYAAGLFNHEMAIIVQYLSTIKSAATL